MIPSQALINKLETLLAADSTSLAPSASANKVHLAAAAFTPSPTLTLASFTEATFTGYAALLAGVSTQQTFTDPATGNGIIQLLEPAGGWHWATTGATGLPQTIYGYYVGDNAGANLWGSALLSTPIVLTGSGQGVDLPNIRLTFPGTPMT